MGTVRMNVIMKNVIMIKGIVFVVLGVLMGSLRMTRVKLSVIILNVDCREGLVDIVLLGVLRICLGMVIATLSVM
jgi:hypothetical protein